MSRFTIGGGLYAPLEVEIDGQVFKVRKMGRAAFRELDAHQAEYDITFKDVDDKNQHKTFATLEKVYSDLLIMFGPEAQDAIESLNIQEASDVMKFVLSNGIVPDKEGEAKVEVDPEKNGPKPGDVTAP